MRVYKDEHFAELYCNQCGKPMKVENEIIKEGNFAVDYRWDYFSDKDGRRHRFDLCENCYNRLIESFQYPIDDEGYRELV